MKILVLTAFHDEAKSFAATLEDALEVTFGKRKCLHGHIGVHEVYLCLCGVGTTSAAANTTALCERLAPDCIFICGSAGGLIPGQQTGDLVLGQAILDLDLHALPEIFPGTPYEPCLTDPHLAQPLDIEFSADPLLLELCKTTPLPNVGIGTIATSNIFPAPPTALETIKARRCHAIDMESSGVCRAAKYYDIPVLAIRAISNSLDAKGHDLGTPPTALAICSDRIRDFLQDLLTRIDALKPLILKS